MAVMISLVYLTVDQGFKAGLLRASNDDLRAIKTAYATAQPASRGTHEAKEMIEDRTLASDAQDRFLLERGPHDRLAGNLPAMIPKLGVAYLKYPQSAQAAANDPGHEVLGRGAFVAPGLYAFVGRDLYDVRHSEQIILLIFAAVLVASVLLAGASGLWLSGSFLRRIDNISDTCRAIMAGRLGERIPTAGQRGELERLAVTINLMLDRIQTLMDSLRHVGNDIAHDLRTPLSHLRATLEKAEADARSVEDCRAAIQCGIEEADRLLEMFSALLRIARIEAGGRRENFQTFELGQLLRRAFDIYAPTLEDTAHPFSLTCAGEAVVFGDPQIIFQVVTNLLDNAIHHTPPGTAIEGWAGMAAGCPTLRIADRGPGIPQHERKRVFDRFVRLEQSRTAAGNGLGLSLVAASADLHEAQVLLEDNAPGLCVAIVFPVRTAPAKTAAGE